MTAAAIGSVAAGFTVAGAAKVTGFGILLAAAAVYFRREETFILSLTTLLQVVLFSSGFVLLTYLGAITARPFADDLLAGWDAALGFHLPDVVAWQAHHPAIGAVLGASYDTLLPQTAALVIILGLAGHRKPLELFVLRMIVAGLATLAFFLMMPAEGPFSHYGFAPSAEQAHYLDHLHTLRSGARTCFSFNDAEGLITFPSFHAIWAILLTVACIGRRGVCLFFAALNAAVILSTLTTGWHYLCDVLAGIVVAAVICLATSEKTICLARNMRWKRLTPTVPSPDHPSVGMKTGTGPATNSGSDRAMMQAVAEPVPVFIRPGQG